MNITRKILIILLSVFLLVSGTAYLVQYYVIMPNFVKLERLQAQANIELIKDTLASNVQNLDSMTVDWASWDDSYGFANNQNPDFIDVNLTKETFINLKLNLIMFFDVEKNLLWGNAYNLKLQKVLKDKDFINKVAAEISTINLPMTGIYIHQGSPILLSSRAILTSQHQGPPAGYLIFGQFVDQSIVNTISKQTNTDFTLEVFNKLESITHYSFRAINTQLLQVSTTLSTLNPARSLKITILHARDITQGGQASLNYALVSLVFVLFCLMIVLIILLKEIIIRPLQEMNQLITDIVDDSNYSLRINTTRKDEVGQLANRFDKLLSQIYKDKEELTKLANTDKLTQLPNRRELDKVLEREWLQLVRNNNPLSIIMCDLDSFKLYNDFYGHQFGDQCLRQVANVLKQSRRRPMDLVARYGGEEFMLVLPDTDHNGALLVASLIKKHLKQEKINHSESEISQWVTLSMGVATTIPTQEVHYESLVNQADKALYVAKQQGRNQICSYQNEFNQLTEKEIALTEDC